MNYLYKFCPEEFIRVNKTIRHRTTCLECHLEIILNLRERKGMERKGTLFKRLVVLALEH